MLAHGMDGGFVFERRIADGVEGGEVGAFQADVLHQPLGRAEEFEVAFIGAARHELSHGGRVSAVPKFVSGDRTANLFDPAQGTQQFFDEGFVRREFGETFGVGRFEVDRDAVGQLHGAIDLVLLGAWHDLEMDVAFEVMPVAQDVGGVEQFILCADSARRDAGTEEDALGESALIHFAEEVREFIRFERGAAKIAPGAERTVVAVAFAGGGEQGLEKFYRFSVGELRRVDEGGALFLGSEAGGFRRFGGGRVAPRTSARIETTGQAVFLGVFEGHLAGEFDEGVEGVHRDIIE